MGVILNLKFKFLWTHLKNGALPSHEDFDRNVLTLLHDYIDSVFSMGPNLCKIIIHNL